MKTLVTGGAGMIGSSIVQQLVRKGDEVRVVDDLSRGKKENLRDVWDRISFLEFDLTKPIEDSQKSVWAVDRVFHLASFVGGVKVGTREATRATVIPTIDRNVVTACVKAKVPELLYTSTACCYPVGLQTEKHVDYLLREEEIMEPGAKPENVYGWCKLLGEIMMQQYAKEYGFKLSIVRDFNVYGPREDANPYTSHVIPSLIKKALEGKSELKVWGTGLQSRSFVYADDAAEGMILAAEKIQDGGAVNLGTGSRVTIKDLAARVAKLCGFKGRITFDPSEPQGVFTRCPDTTKARQMLGWKPKVSLDEGLAKTVDWYKSQMVQAYAAN
jgi:nucleoside-diphosphate-sugar epimerase